MKLFLKIFSLLVSSQNLRKEGANTFDLFSVLHYLELHHSASVH